MRILRPAPAVVFLSTDDPAVVVEAKASNAKAVAVINAAGTSASSTSSTSSSPQCVSGRDCGDLWVDPQPFYLFTENKRSNSAQSDLLNGAKFGTSEFGSEEAVIAWTNLFLAARSHVYIGTSSSNWCHLVDQLRLLRGDCVTSFIDVEREWNRPV